MKVLYGQFLTCCHVYVDTSNMRVKHTLRYYFQNTPRVCDICW
jgi:hypothetical protein